MRVASQIVLTQDERNELTRLVRSKLTSVRLEQRASIVLLAADGFQNQDIAQMLGVGRVQVGRWRQRYALCAASPGRHRARLAARSAAHNR